MLQVPDYIKRQPRSIDDARHWKDYVLYFLQCSLIDMVLGVA